MNTRLVRLLARKFTNTGMDEEDLVQEGMLAYMRAVGTYNPDAGVQFDTYASRVITNRYLDLVRRKPETDMHLNVENTIAEFSIDDEIDLIQINEILQNNVPEMERAIFNAYVQGFSYEEISKIFDLPRKKIDNTVQKVKRQIKSDLN